MWLFPVERARQEVEPWSPLRGAGSESARTSIDSAQHCNRSYYRIIKVVTFMAPVAQLGETEIEKAT